MSFGKMNGLALIKRHYKEKDSDGKEKDVLYKGSDGKYHMDFSFVIGKCDKNRFKLRITKRCPIYGNNIFSHK